MSLSDQVVEQFVSAARNGDRRNLERILREGKVTVNSQANDGWTALIYAAHYGHREICEMLISEGCDVDIQNSIGNTALRFAAWFGHKEICEMILSKGCNIDIQNVYGNAALSSAAIKGCKEICEMILSKGANINMQNIWGHTALIRAAWKGHEEVCDFLISRSCNFDIAASFTNGVEGLYLNDEERDDLDGATAYTYACYEGHVRIAISLIEAGCNYSLTNKLGKCGMDFLKEKHPSKVDKVKVTALPVRGFCFISSLSQLTDSLSFIVINSIISLLTLLDVS